MKDKLLWLIYKRLRIGFAFLGFVIMYGAYSGNLDWHLFSLGLAVFSIEIFGAAYNDYIDFEEDIRNERHDKWTVSGLLSRNQMKYFSFIMLSSGLFFAWFSGLLLQGIYYAFMMWAYSYEKIRLKRYNIIGYFLLGSSWLIMPISMSMVFSGSVSLTDIFFMSFCFFQYVYLLSQKDSTDPKDDTNLFLTRGWSNSLKICTLLSVLSSAFLFAICLVNVNLIFVWGINLIAKVSHLYKILTRSITRSLRSKFVLTEFITPYLYTGVII